MTAAGAAGLDLDKGELGPLPGDVWMILRLCVRGDGTCGRDEGAAWDEGCCCCRRARTTPGGADDDGAR